MDYSLFKDVNGLSGSQPFDGIFKFAANDLIYVMVVLVALAFLVPGGPAAIARRRGAVAATLSAALGLLVVVPVSHIVDRVRPFVAHPGHAHLLIQHGRDAGFPSDHATGAFGLAMGMCLYYPPLGLLLLALGVIIAFARVYVGVHYPGDVIGGALIGVAAALVLHLPALRRLIERFADFAMGIGDGALGRVRRTGVRA